MFNVLVDISPAIEMGYCFPTLFKKRIYIYIILLEFDDYILKWMQVGIDSSFCLRIRPVVLLL